MTSSYFTQNTVRSTQNESVVEYKLKIPDSLDLILSVPVLLYRLFRHGHIYRRIPLTQGQYSKVDVDNFYRFIKHKWQACRDGDSFYVRRTVYDKGKQTTLHMHRIVLNAPKGLQVDHINGDTTDNRRANLRLANSSQNCCNRHIPSRTSKYKGVYYERSENRYRVCIMKNGKRISIGRFKDEIEAARAYDSAALKYHKEFAKLNFPKENRLHPIPCTLYAKLYGEFAKLNFPCPERRRRAKIDWFYFIKKLRNLPPNHDPRTETTNEHE